MPWLLYRHMLGELLKVFGITAAVLVFVTAIGAAIKPLAADDLIGPAQTIKYILLATVPMLQFALPFAAGFAATLVLHRMTSDNEILAASVSGISHGRLVAPLAALGLALLLVMVGLTQWVIPRFWALMERHLAADVTRLFQASIAKGLPLTVGNMQLYADGIRIQENPPDSEAELRLHLNRLAAARLDDAGKIVADITAGQAAVDIYHRGGHTLLMLATRDAVGYDERSGQLFHTTGSNASQPIVMPAAFQDDPMFKTQGQLLHLRDHPDDDPGVRQSKTRLATALRRHECGQAIDRELAESGRADLIGAGGRVIVTAARFNGRRFTPPQEAPIAVRVLAGSRLVREIEAMAAELRPAIDSDPRQPTFDLILDDVQIVDHDRGGATNRRARLTLSELAPSTVREGNPAELPYGEMLALADAAGSSVDRERHGLENQVRSLRLEITARLLRRYALSLTALLLLVLGALLAMVLRHSLPLVIYIFAFVPSILNVLLISGGDHMIRHGAVPGGVAMMWSGNVLMVILLAVVYLRLIRH